MFLACAEVGNSADEFFGVVASGESSLRVGPVVFRLAQLARVSWRGLRRLAVRPVIGFDEFGSQPEVLGVIDTVGMLCRLHPKLRFVFPVQEAGEAQYARGVGCGGIASELAHHGPLQGLRLFLRDVLDAPDHLKLIG